MRRGISRAVRLLGVTAVAAVTITVAPSPNANASGVQFAAPSLYDTSVATPAGVVLADVNRDGLADLVSVSGSTDFGGTKVLDVRLAGTSGSLGTRTATVLPSAGGAAKGVAVGDVTSDGVPDVIVTRYPGLVVLPGVGDGTFAPPVAYSVPGQLMQPVVADFNGDGRLDVAAANYYHDSFYGAVSVLLNDGQGALGAAANVDLGQYSFPHALIAGDVNGDGLVDLVTTNNVFYVLLNDGTGTFTPKAPVAIQHNSIAFPSMAVNWQIVDVAVGDYNGDGKSDVAAVTSNETPGLVWFLPGVGDGTYLNQEQLHWGRVPGDTPSNVVSADVDGDGLPEPVVPGNKQASSLYVFGNRDSSGWPTILSSSSPYAYSTRETTEFPMATGDFNGDGAPDFAVADTLSTTGGVFVTQGVRPSTDVVPPVVTGTPDRLTDSNGWYNHDVTITWAVSDPTPSSGAPNVPSPTTVASEGQSFQYQSGLSCDPANNCATGSGTLSLDKTAPAVTGTTPADGGSYTYGSAIFADYSCSDGLSGVATCSTGTVDTSPGPHSLSVSATDNAGNTTNRTFNYTVVDGSASGSVGSAGGTVTTDPSGTGATTLTPVQTSVTTPVGGAVSIATSSTVTQAVPSTYDVIGQQVQIEAPQASVASPLALTFTVDSSKLGLQSDGSTLDASNLIIVRNGTPILTDCDPAYPGQAIPDPCVQSRATLNGDAVITVLSSHASTWNLAYHKPYLTSSPFFGSPISNTSRNYARAGNVISLKFRLGGNQGTSIFAAGSPSSATFTPCAAPTGKYKVIQGSNSGAPTLTYDKKSHQYTYLWRTSTSWSSTCRTLTMVLSDGSRHSATFYLTR